MFRRLDFLGVLLGFVAQGGDLRMPVKRVVVERDFGVEAFELALRRDDQRIDFEHRHILGDEGRIELRGQFFRLFGETAGKAEDVGDRPAVVRHDPGRRIDRETSDPVRRVMRHFLDVHAAFGRNNESDAARRSIDKEGKIEFLDDIGAFLEINPVDLLAGRAGLYGHEGPAEHFVGQRSRPRPPIWRFSRPLCRRPPSP